jgi:hypothetical protein
MRTIYTMNELSDQPISHDKDNGVWHLAKPENVKPGNAGWLRWRIKASWHVLRGRAVPVRWM